MSCAFLSFRNVTKTFDTETVLNCVSVELFPNEITFIMGVSGVGKSVFLRLALAFERPDFGTIQLAGLDISSISARSINNLRKKHVLVFQNPALFDFLTPIENVAFPVARHHPEKPQQKLREKAKTILADLGFFQSNQDGVPPWSVGEAKTISIARAVMMDPNVVFFDEPTTGLDPLTRQRVDRQILNLKRERGIGCVVISHDVSSALSIADRVLMLHRQQFVVDSRCPTELLRMTDSVVGPFFNSGLIF